MSFNLAMLSWVGHGWAPLGCLKEILGAPGAALARFWQVLWRSWADLSLTWGLLGTLCGFILILLNPLEKRLGASWDAFWAFGALVTPKMPTKLDFGGFDFRLGDPSWS